MDSIKPIDLVSGLLVLKHIFQSGVLRLYRRGFWYFYYTALFRFIDTNKRIDLLIRYVNKNLKELNTTIHVSDETTFAHLGAKMDEALSKDLLKLKLSNYSSKNILSRSNTSGSTGKPMTMYFNRKDIQKTYAIWDHYLWNNGVRRNDRRARFSGRLGKNDPLYIDLPLLNLRLYNSYRVQENDLAQLTRSLKEWDPVLIEGYPSMISTISKFLLKSEKRLTFGSLKVISTTAETLFEYDRNIIESAFNVRVSNQYASSEGSPFIAECAFGKLHLYLYSGIIRKVFDRDIYLVTSFRSTKFPLINYNIGDRFVLNEEDRIFGSNCQCGSIHPLITDVLGRNDDFILDENQNPIQRLDIIYKGLY